MIVDFHTHTFPEAIAAVTLQKLSAASRTLPFTDGTAADLQKSMARSGIDLSVLMPVATKPRQVPVINHAAEEISRKSTGLISFGGIHPDYPDWKEELDRIAALGLKGIKLHPVYQGVDQDDIRYLRILERAAELDLIVLTHAGIDIGYPGEYRCTPAMLRKIMEQIGPLKLVAAHMGGWKCWEEAEDQLVGTGIFLDTACSIGTLSPVQNSGYTSEYLQMLQEEEFVRMVRAFGSDHVLFGSDSPWGDPSRDTELIRAASLTDTEKESILSGNAVRLLKLQPS